MQSNKAVQQILQGEIAPLWENMQDQITLVRAARELLTTKV